MYRQGDLLIVPIRNNIPSTAVPRADGIIIQGEERGHAHRADVARAKVLDHQERIFLKVLEPVSILHEEHAPIPLAPGEYEAIRQREYTGKWRTATRD